MAADRVVIAGGTGLLGGALAQALSEVRPEVEVIVLSRGGPRGSAPGDAPSAHATGTGGPRVIGWRPDAAATGAAPGLYRLARLVVRPRARRTHCGAPAGAGPARPGH